MSKEEQEFHAIDNVPWTTPPGGSGAAADGVTEKILNWDPEKGVGSRLLHFEPGSETDEVISHDFWEEVYVLEGGLHDKNLNQTFTAGMYACRPPGMPHGPYTSPDGCTTFRGEVLRLEVMPRCLE